MDTQNSTQTDPIQQPPTSDSNWISYFIRGTLWFLAGLLVYILAVGPAAWLEIKYPATKPAIETMYAPLAHLCERYQPLGNALIWYIATVWRVPIPPMVY